MMNRRALDIWVGFFVALGFAAILFLALKVASSATLAAADGYEVKGKFDNIGGLKVRAPVKSAGVVVGRVAAIRFDNESFEAVVSMNVDNRYKFPKDTSAKILTSGLLGERISTKPVEVVTPFPWVRKNGNQKNLEALKKGG